MDIALDMDDTIVGLLDAWLCWLNDKYGFSYKRDDVISWKMSDIIPLTDEQIFEPLYLKEFWKTVKPLPDAIDSVNKLVKLGHNVKIATASYYKALPMKLEECLFKHFNMTYKDVIVIQDKSWLKCDILVDDNNMNLRYFKGIRVLVDAPYNKYADYESYDYRISNLKELLEIIPPT